MKRGRLIHQIAVHIIFHDKAAAIPPVIEDLRAKDMSSQSPGQVVIRLTKPLMAQRLDSKVVHLEAGVVDVVIGPGATTSKEVSPSECDRRVAPVFTP